MLCGSDMAPTLVTRSWSVSRVESECSGMIHPRSSPPLLGFSVTMRLSPPTQVPLTRDNLDRGDQQVYDFLYNQHIPCIPDNNSYCCGFVIICQHFRINIIVVTNMRDMLDFT